jgi:deoxyribodipyrimidine photo-lyase
MVPAVRIRTVHAGPLRRDGTHIVYWMTAARRTRWSWALQHAVEVAVELGRPLVICEALRAGYPYACDRFHRFALDGMADNAAACAAAGVTYLPYVEPAPGAGSGLIAALARTACAVVTDEAPVFFLPRMLAATAPRLPCRVDAVDGNGLLPLAAAGRSFGRAVDFRRHLQRTAREFLGAWPDPEPLRRVPRLPAPALDIASWPVADLRSLRSPGGLAHLPIDHGIGVVPESGGQHAAAAALDRFLAQRLDRYAEERSDPDADVASGLSPWLHWGHLAAGEVLHTVLQRAGWSPDFLGATATASKDGWWGLDAASESFIDELVVWRELGYGYCHHHPDHGRYDTLPAWCRATLDAHRGDPRQVVDAGRLAAGDSPEPLWNAAQRCLVRTGRMPNYLRMLWGKLVLAWTPTPEAAWDLLFTLNDRYALDGRDPNSSTGIAWVFGRFDRPWAPERPIYGVLRYMTADSTRRKLRLKRWQAEQDLAGSL